MPAIIFSELRLSIFLGVRGDWFSGVFLYFLPSSLPCFPVTYPPEVFPVFLGVVVLSRIRSVDSDQRAPLPIVGNPTFLVPQLIAPLSPPSSSPNVYLLGPLSTFYYPIQYAPESYMTVVHLHPILFVCALFFPDP